MYSFLLYSVLCSFVGYTLRFLYLKSKNSGGKKYKRVCMTFFIATPFNSFWFSSNFPRTIPFWWCIFRSKYMIPIHSNRIYIYLYNIQIHGCYMQLCNFRSYLVKHVDIVLLMDIWCNHNEINLPKRLMVAESLIKMSNNTRFNFTYIVIIENVED